VTGFSRRIGPFYIRLHDPHGILIAAALMSGGLVYVCWRTRARAFALIVAAAVGTLGAVALTRAAETMFPLGDIAVIELYVRNALTGHLLVGPYSRFGWHHPGPAYFYLLAPFYAWASKTTASLAAGSVAIALASFALLMWTCARSVGPRASAAIAGAAVIFLWRVPGLLASAWNPHVIVVPTIALIAACAAAAGGDLPFLPIAAVLASVIVQTDVALVPVAGVLCAAAAAACAASRWQDNRQGALKSLNASAWLLLLLWILPLAEEFTHTPGNITLLARFFTGAHAKGQTFAAARVAWAAMIDGVLLPSFSLASGGTFAASGKTLLIALAVAQLAALLAAALFARHREPNLSRLAVFSLGASLAALWSVTRIEDRIMDHEVFWISGVAALNLGVIIAAAVSAAGARTETYAEQAGKRGAIVHAALVSVVLLMAFKQAERARDGRLPVTPTSPVVERLTGSVRQYLEGKDAHKPFIRIGEETWGLAAGVLLQADRGSIPFAVEDSWMPMFPQAFAANGEEDSEVAFGNSDEHAARMRIAGAEPIASFSNVFIDGIPHKKP